MSTLDGKLGCCSRTMIGLGCVTSCDCSLLLCLMLTIKKEGFEHRQNNA